VARASEKVLFASQKSKSEIAVKTDAWVTWAMAVTCTSRSALAVFLSFSLLSLPCVAQPAPQQGAQNVAAAAGRASINFPPDPNDPVALQCDQLADQPRDAQRVGEGVAFKKIQVDQALSVCEQAAERQPARPRYQYLYGRVLNAAQRYPEAAAQFTAADQAGYGFASFGLAELYRDAAGVAGNWEEAARLYHRAGNAGIADAFAKGGMLFARETPPDYGEAKSWFEHAVQGGSADGYADLGGLYETGFGVNKDAAMALSLFNEAAKRGSAEGMYRVGVAYYDGLGVPKDLATACQWFVRAGSYAHPYAQEEGGLCYYNGDGVPPNHETAFNWFVDAGQAGLVIARVQVANMLDRGDGHDKDQAGAVQWYQAAAEQGDFYAMTELGAHLRLGQGVAWNEAQAMQWFAKAAQQKYVPAESSLAIGYENGLGQEAGQGKQDYQQAAYWFGQAADQDDGYAQLNLGVMYEKGWGVPQNLERAKQLYARAAGSSNAAVANLGKQYFSDVPDSAPPDGTPQRTAVSSSKDSSDFWATVIVGALAIGAVSLLTSGGSSDSSGSGSPSGGGVSTGIGTTWPSSSSNSSSTTSNAPFKTPFYPSQPGKIPMGNLGDPDVSWK
jgi:TPR repeat protein